MSQASLRSKPPAWEEAGWVEAGHPPWGRPGLDLTPAAVARSYEASIEARARYRPRLSLSMKCEDHRTFQILGLRDSKLMRANSPAQRWAQSSAHAVRILSVIFRGYANLQTVSGGLETFKEVKIDATGSQLTLARLLLGDPRCPGCRARFMVLPWARPVSRSPAADLRKVFPSSGESDRPPGTRPQCVRHPLREG